MNKGVIYSIAAVGAVGLIYFILGFSGILKVYNIPTSADEPNIKTGSYVVASNLVSPQNGDFITYKFDDSIFGGARVHRMIGVAGDEVKIEDGILYLNEINFDKSINLYFSFGIDRNKRDLLLRDKIIPNEIMYQMGIDLFLINTSKSIAKKYGFEDKILIKSKDEILQDVSKDFNNSRNRDNIGPITIPKGKCFVIGDNRHNSQDSRHIGLIDTKAITGVLINK